MHISFTFHLCGGIYVPYLMLTHH